MFPYPIHRRKDDFLTNRTTPHFEPYMAARFAFIDATIADDEEALEQANEAMDAGGNTAEAVESSN